VKSPPNQTLLRVAAEALEHRGAGVLVDIGCGAGRNGEPLALQGWSVLGLDLSMPMLAAAAARADERRTSHLRFACAAMNCLPVATATADFVVAHGIWNLAREAAEFRAAVREGRRIARPDARLFVFTFSRSTLPDNVLPVPGEPFVFTEFSGEPLCFLTGQQLVEELAAAGFEMDPVLPLRELNRRQPGAVQTGPPVIFEGLFRAVP
jgi:SAM-dependent methyltransferase